MNDLNILGSATLMIMSFWFLFNIRRENRAIVGLLKDVRNITDFDTEVDKNLKQDNMLIASMAFQEVAHSMTFVSVAKDLPLSSKHIFDENPKDGKFEQAVRFSVYTLRFVGMAILLFSPVLVISFTFYADYISMEMNTAFYEGFPKIGGTMSDYFRNVFETRMWFAGVCLLITFIICCLTIILQLKTTDALYVFAEKLGVDVETRFVERLKSWWETPKAPSNSPTENEK